ncbi:hypothetical protein [uncultured Microbacterium sp.]|uniref:hypothetical protein n=1 Tax=uncultured Microbacterium sp. TaxID=191216 RepID=UPI0028E79A15|nr:hypothetical protein [uncultured Microbacterium sp.]
MTKTKSSGSRPAVAWRDAGCPDVDALPVEVNAALSKWIPLKRSLDIAAAEKKAADEMKKAIAKRSHAARRALRRSRHGVGGGFQSSVTESTSIDEAAWKATSPEVHAHAESLRVELALIEASALKHYPKTARRTSLRFQEVENVG